MQINVKTFKDHDTKQEKARVQLKVDDQISLAARPFNSIADAMKAATKLCHHLGIGYYRVNSKVINVK